MLDYGTTHMSSCCFVIGSKPTTKTKVTMKQNEYGFTLVNFNQMFSFFKHSFVFPIHVEQMNECKVKWLKNNKIFTLHKVHKKCLNRHGCYFLIFHYCNIWLINLHPPTNPLKLRSKLTSKNVHGICNFLKGNPQSPHGQNPMSTFQKICFSEFFLNFF